MNKISIVLQIIICVCMMSSSSVAIHSRTPFVGRNPYSWAEIFIRGHVIHELNKIRHSRAVIHEPIRGHRNVIRDLKQLSEILQ